MKQPHLIQRGCIKTPLQPGSVRLSEAVEMDYMGSSYFEWGALPKSLRSMEGKSLVLRKVPSIVDGERVLRVLSFLSDDDFKKYEEYLLLMRRDKIHLEEISGFEQGSDSYYSRNTDFWWDIENHVMWSFHKVFMNRVADQVRSSLRYMNAKRETSNA